MEFWFFLAVGIFIGAGIAGLICFLAIGKWYVGDLREDWSSGEDQPYYFMEIPVGGLRQVKKNKFVLLRMKRENYDTKFTSAVMGENTKQKGE